MPSVTTKNEPHYQKLISHYVSALSSSSSRGALVEELVEPITTIAKTSGGDKCEADLWTLWSNLITTALKPPTEDTEAHDALVHLVSDIKALGPLKTDGTVASTSNGQLWTDLPLLGSQFREQWNMAPPKLSAAEWANLNMFAARLTASGVIDLSLYAIWSLRQALEDKRPLTRREEDGEPTNTMDAPIEDFLPAALAWIEGCGERLVELCSAGKSFGTGPDPSKLGFLASEGNVDAEEDGLATEGRTGKDKLVGKVEESGFNKQRWLFWRSRFLAISEKRDDAGGREKVAKLAYQGFEKMKTWDAKVGA